MLQGEAGTARALGPAPAGTVSHFPAACPAKLLRQFQGKQKCLGSPLSSRPSPPALPACHSPAAQAPAHGLASTVGLSPDAPGRALPHYSRRTECHPTLWIRLPPLQQTHSTNPRSAAAAVPQTPVDGPVAGLSHFARTRLCAALCAFLANFQTRPCSVHISVIHWRASGHVHTQPLPDTVVRLARDGDGGTPPLGESGTFSSGWPCLNFWYYINKNSQHKGFLVIHNSL